MEGILPPLTGTESNLTVPCLSPPILHDVEIPVHDIAQRSGLSRADNAIDLVSSCTDMGTLASLMQDRLFFEPLSAFLGASIKREDLAVDGAIDLNQRRVHDCFRAWRSDLSKLPTAERRQRQESLNGLLNSAFWKCEEFEDAADCFGEGDEIFDTVALSVRLLISLLSNISEDTFETLRSPWREYLAHNLPFVFGYHKEWLDRSILVMDRREAIRYLAKQPRTFLPLPPGDDIGGRATKLLLQRYTDNGWCPSRARQLCRSNDFLLANSLATLNLNHARLSTRSHQGCQNLDNCAAYQIDDTSWDTYPFQHTRHHALEDSCDFVSSNKAEINKIIDAGGIPIISMGLDENHLDLRVHTCTPWLTYTAISHVWSDGLGNPMGNSLYRCQLFRLREMIRQNDMPEHGPKYDGGNWWSRFKSRYSWNKRRSFRAGKPDSSKSQDRVYFWMDTLCIPRSPKPREMSDYGSIQDFQRSVEDFERDKKLKKLALQHITPVYAGAYNVLVLDSALQSVDASGEDEFSGDKFAALVLSSNWMQRGWTLEEGCLAQNCVFRLMGKPYEMSESMQLSLTPLKWQDSPLHRSIFQARQNIPTVLRKALMDEKRQLTTDGKIIRSKILKKEIRIPQFVRSWNSLYERSTTEPEDRILLFANLLDFNVHSLDGLNEEQKLPSLVQSCEELPLSLLYNTGPRLHIEAHPEFGWVPTDITGVKLVGGAILRRTYPRKIKDQVCFRIDQGNCEREFMLFLKTVPTEPIPLNVGIFSVQNQCASGINQEYFVEIQRPGVPGSYTDRVQRQSQGTCIAIDLSCGSRSSRGFAGRGARLNIFENLEKEMSLQFEAPLIVYTPEQWGRKCKEGYPTTLQYDVEEVNSSQRLLLKFDASIWPRKLARRPVLTQHPTSAWTVSLIIFIATFLLLCAFIAIVLDVSGTSWQARLVPWIAVGVALMPNRYMAMYTYKTWLKSFEKKWANPTARRSPVAHLASFGKEFGEVVAERLGRLDLRFLRRNRTESASRVQVLEGIALREAP